MELNQNEQNIEFQDSENLAQDDNRANMTKTNVDNNKPKKIWKNQQNFRGNGKGQKGQPNSGKSKKKMKNGLEPENIDFGITNKYYHTNLSSRLIERKFFNRNVITQTFRSVTNQTVNIDLTVKPNNSRLKKQATVFARKIFSLQDLYLRKMFGTLRSDWVRNAYESYIYSYYKCLLYAIAENRVAEVSNFSYVCLGHGVLYRCLTRPVHTFRQNDMYINYRFKFSKADFEQICDSANEFPFIRDYIEDSPRFYLENQDIERNLNALARNIPPGVVYPWFTMFNDVTKQETHLTPDCFPIGNSFYSQNLEDENKWFYSYSQDSNVLSLTTLFGKACFICCIDNSECANYFDLNNQDDNDYLVKYETRSIAGSFYPNYSSNDSLMNEIKYPDFVFKRRKLSDKEQDLEDDPE